ncbi:hypothetical protein [uncultured Clostridium sp.]|uniref:hypothetical protein n=2 Tax=Clostridium TaxID=1485 RepID=UPI00261CF5AC|nr:hypothetical protein [uncultured Clostridium sp.]
MDRSYFNEIYGIKVSKMEVITTQEHKELIYTLKELEDTVNEMIKVSKEQILIWHMEEIVDWLEFLVNHTDKDELQSLKKEIADRFFYKYDVSIEPKNLDEKRLNLFRKIMIDFNNVLR